MQFHLQIMIKHINNIMFVNYCSAFIRKISIKCGRILILTLLIISTILILIILYKDFFYESENNEIKGSFEFFKQSRNLTDYIQPYNDSAIINVQQPIECQQFHISLNNKFGKADGRMNVIYFVMSPPENYKQRSAIRETWGHHVKPKPIFIMGVCDDMRIMERVINEAKIYQDIIIERFIESYQKLVIKTAFMFKHYLNLCPNSKYLMKIDDDMFINPKIINTMIEKRLNNSIETNESVIIGKFYNRYRPHRNPNSKWYLPTWLYYRSFLPNYVSGTSYLISGGNAAKSIYEMSLKIPIINLEDVYFSGIIASEILGYRLINDRRFTDNKPLINYYCLYK